MTPGKITRTAIPNTFNLIDTPDEEPEDPKLAYSRFMSRVAAPIDFEKQRSKRDLLNDAIKPLADRRFEVIHDIS